MPFLTFRVQARLERYAPDAKLRLEREPRMHNNAASEAYTVYVGPHPIGRFTVRESEAQVERVFWCGLP